MTPCFEELSFFPQPESIISIVGSHSASFFLDSSDPNHADSLFSFAGINPSEIWTGDDNPWQVLPKVVEAFWDTIPTPFPFAGGILGYLDYETRLFAEKGGVRNKQGLVPGHWFAQYDAVLVMDHRSRKAYVACWREDRNMLQKAKEEWRDLLEHAPSSAPLTPPSPIPSTPSTVLRTGSLRTGKGEGIIIPSRDSFAKKVLRIKDYLAAGDAYQVNLTERFEALSPLLVSVVYGRLRRLSPAPFSAFVNAGAFQILSSSPESLLNIRDGIATTRPIKGTRRRSPLEKEDYHLRKELMDSAKDRAELLMIVDLERNDLGKVCECGSVNVEYLRELESYAQLHHLAATVRGRIKKGLGPLEVLRALFPGGSVTGAPKKRAMEIIDELEENSRSIYTGALGYIGAGGSAHFNIPIRTMTQVGQKVYFHAGCGIVADSEPELEYEEMMLKTEGMMEALKCKST